MRYDQWGQEPWRVIEGIEFRAVTLTAVKGEGTPSLDVGQAVIYQGPYASVSDDEGHFYPRGARIAVCERTYRLLTTGPYREAFIGINPGTPRAAVPLCAPAGTRRPAAETKGAAMTIASATPGCDRAWPILHVMIRTESVSAPWRRWNKNDGDVAWNKAVKA